MERYQNFAINLDEAGVLLPDATITVYEFGTQTLAALFSDDGGVTPLANPFTAAADGFFGFYADDGLYDIVVSRALPLPAVTPYTFTAVRLATPAP